LKVRYFGSDTAINANITYRKRSIYPELNSICKNEEDKVINGLKKLTPQNLEEFYKIREEFRSCIVKAREGKNSLI
jgi:hypothetical protein